MAPPMVTEAAVRARLDRVMDPELDEPITDMGFVEAVDVSAEGDVDISFRLPTYWCAPNFAFMMADGAQREVGALPGVRRVRVTLEDHLFAEELNRGVAAGKDFTETFRDLAGGEDLRALERQFEDKAFQRRQEAVLRDLRAQGLSDAEIVDLTLARFDATAFAGEEARWRAPLYRELLLKRGLARYPDDLAFRTLEGDPLSVSTLQDHLHALRQVRINMEFNGSMCRSLKRTRYMTAERTAEGLRLADLAPGRAAAAAL